MHIIVTDLDGTLTTGSSWQGFRNYFKKTYSALACNNFFHPLPAAFSADETGPARSKEYDDCLAAVRDRSHARITP